MKYRGLLRILKNSKKWRKWPFSRQASRLDFLKSPIFWKIFYKILRLRLGITWSRDNGDQWASNVFWEFSRRHSRLKKWKKWRFFGDFWRFLKSEVQAFIKEMGVFSDFYAIGPPFFFGKMSIFPEKTRRRLNIRILTLFLMILDLCLVGNNFLTKNPIFSRFCSTQYYIRFDIQAYSYKNFCLLFNM